MAEEDMATLNPTERLNRFFYSQPPMPYFNDRLTLLALRANKPDELAELASGIEWGQLRLRTSTRADIAEHELARATTSFVMTESQTLFHHAAETLVRLFLSHRDQPECPWLETAAFLSFAKFKKELDTLASPVWSPQLKREVEFVFLGGSPKKPDEQWKVAHAAAERFLRHIAGRLLSDKNLYNSSKHGLTAIGTEGSLAMFTDEGEQVMATEGSQVVYLEKGEAKTKDAGKWFETTRWIDPRQTVWLTQLTLSQMEALWHVAKFHYIDGPLDGVELVTDEGIDMAISGFPRTGSFTSFRRVIAVEQPPGGMNS